MNEIKFDKVYDLSVLVYNDMQMHPAEAASGCRSRVFTHGFPMHLPPIRNEQGGPEPGWPIHSDLMLTTHTGTHVDAPYHFNKHGRRIDELPLDLFMGKAVVLDFQALAGLLRHQVRGSGKGQTRHRGEGYPDHQYGEA